MDTPKITHKKLESLNIIVERLNYKTPIPGFYQEESRDISKVDPHNIPIPLRVYYITGERKNGLQPESGMAVDALIAEKYIRFKHKDKNNSILIDSIDAGSFYLIPREQMEILLDSCLANDEFIKWVRKIQKKNEDKQKTKKIR